MKTKNILIQKEEKLKKEKNKEEEDQRKEPPRRNSILHRERRDSETKPFTKRTQNLNMREGEKGQIEIKEEKDEDVKSKDKQKKSSSPLIRDYKLDRFYQSNHRPLTAIKEILAIMSVVILYDYPIFQTMSVTGTLAIFLTLDYYYKPFRDSQENLDLTITGTIFLLISACLASLSLTSKLLSRKLTFYSIGYLTIFLISLLIGRNFVMTFTSFYQGLMEILKNLKNRNKKSWANVIVVTNREDVGEYCELAYKVRFVLIKPVMTS